MKKTSRGFTLLETVIALSIIVIVSAATLTLVLSSHAATRRATERQAAAGYTADLVTCYRATSDEAEFFEAAAFALGLSELREDIPTTVPGTAFSARVIYDTALSAEILDSEGEVLSRVTFYRGGGSG